MAVGDFRFSLLLLSFTAAVAATSSDDRRKALSEAGAKGKKEEPSRGIFAPRMYYDEWTPLGHGDPLKNDPTYDYVPPVLEHVHYWKEPNQRSPSTEPPFTGPSLNARRDPPDLADDVKVVQAPHPSNLFQTLPDIPPTMLVPPPPPPPPPPRIETSNVQPTRAAPTTIVDVEPINMILHSSTTISWLDFKNPVATMPSGSPAPWKGSNTPIVEPSPLPTMTHTSASPFQRYRDELKERPFSQNSIFIKHSDGPVSNNLGHKPHFPVAKNNQPLPPVVKPTIPIQQGQPFRLPQSNPAPARPNNADDTESYASILQSLLDDTPTTTELSVRIVSTTPPSVATTTSSALTTDHIFSHYKQPAVPVTAPLYLIIQGHSKVKTYGASKSPILEIPHNEVLKDNKSKNRHSRDAGTSHENGRDVSESENEGQTLPKRLVKNESDSSG